MPRSFPIDAAGPRGFNTRRMGIGVDRLVPMAHVTEVERSIQFYKLLGFKVDARRRDGERTHWAWLSSGSAALMLAAARAAGLLARRAARRRRRSDAPAAPTQWAAADQPVDPRQQAILFYLYCSDVAALLQHLLASGVADAGKFGAGPCLRDGLYVAFELTYPDYMPKGELRVADPDGYCLLIGSLS